MSYPVALKWDINFLAAPASGSVFAETDLLGSLKRKEPLFLERLFKKHVDLTTGYEIRQAMASDLLVRVDASADIWELKFHLSDEVRYLGYVDYSSDIPTFQVLVAFKKKTMKLKMQYVRLAKQRKKMFGTSNTQT